MIPVHVIPLADLHRDWTARTITERWGAPVVVSCGRIHQAAELDGFVAFLREDPEAGQTVAGSQSSTPNAASPSDETAATDPIGLATYRVEGTDCELTTLDSMREGRGVGTALIRAVEEEARRRGCRRVWLITTNDNTRALRFYQRLGYRIAALHPGAMEEARRLKPQIPLLGADGIPIRDEIELERSL